MAERVLKLVDAPQRRGRIVAPIRPGPVTSAEVLAMFKAIGCVLPDPAERRCKVLADFMTSLIDEESEAVERFVDPKGARPGPTFAELKRRRDAIGVLKHAVAKDRASMKGFAGPIHLTFWAEMDAALHKADSLLAPPKPQGEPWHDWGFRIASVVLNAFKVIGIEYKTVSENNKASAFTQLALSRLGYPNVTRGMIAKHYKATVSRRAVTSGSERNLPPGGNVL